MFENYCYGDAATLSYRFTDKYFSLSECQSVCMAESSCTSIYVRFPISMEHMGNNMTLIDELYNTSTQLECTKFHGNLNGDLYSPNEANDSQDKRCYRKVRGNIIIYIYFKYQ